MLGHWKYGDCWEHLPLWPVADGATRNDGPICRGIQDISAAMVYSELRIRKRLPEVLPS